ncbi:MAG TPA: hypothetical protein VFP72_04445 [Kineosporiaceae bacterium]|nr:hypothetical protein [Kineosporiaceae bacterium]
MTGLLSVTLLVAIDGIIREYGPTMAGSPCIGLVVLASALGCGCCTVIGLRRLGFHGRAAVWLVVWAVAWSATILAVLHNATRVQAAEEAARAAGCSPARTAALAEVPLPAGPEPQGDPDGSCVLPLDRYRHGEDLYDYLRQTLPRHGWTSGDRDGERVRFQRGTLTLTLELDDPATVTIRIR